MFGIGCAIGVFGFSSNFVFNFLQYQQHCLIHGRIHRSQLDYEFRRGWAVAGEVGFLLATREKRKFGQWVGVSGLLCFWLNVDFLFYDFWLTLVGVRGLLSLNLNFFVG
jgi:hypothetical protein